MRMMAIGAGLAAIALTGCEEFTFEDRTEAELAYTALQDDTLALRSELDDLGVTAAIDVPTAGTATYDGTAMIALDTTTRASEVIGTASITADFATDRVSGSMTGFYGTIDDGDVTAFDGNITISKGLIDTTATTVIETKVDGTLVGGGDVLVVNATLDGNFRGNPFLINEAPAGIVLDGSDTSIYTLNGAAVDGDMEVLGLRE